MRKSSLFFYSLITELMVLSLLLLYGAIDKNSQQESLQEKAMLVETLQLTDLCLFTEARYTRHLSQADLNTAFQDHPVSLEHFPSGSFTQPPFTGMGSHEQLD